MKFQKQANAVQWFKGIANSLKGAGKAFRGWHIAEELGRAGKWGVEVGQFGSRYAGKALSLTGNVEKVSARIASYEKHIADILGKLKVSKLLAENADKTLKISEIFEKEIDKTKVIADIIESNKGLIQKVMTEKNLTKEIDAIKYLTETNKVFKAEYAAKLGANMAAKFETASKQNIEFIKTLQKSLENLKAKSSFNPEKLKQISGATSNIDEMIAKGDLLSAAKTVGELGDKSLIDAAKLAQENAEFVSHFSGVLKSSDLLSAEGRAIAVTLGKAVGGFQFVSPMNAITIKNVGLVSSTASAILFGAAMAGGGLIGENVKLFKEIQLITHKIIDLLRELSGQNNDTGKAWETNKNRLIKSLSLLDGIDISAYEKANGNTMTASDMETTVNGIEDLSTRFEGIGAALNEIANSKSLEGLYEQGAASIGQSATSYFDNMNPGAAFGITGYMNKYNSIKELSRKGLEVLQSSGEKISKASDELNNKLMEHDMGGQVSEASNIINQFIVTAELLDHVNYYTNIDKIELQIKKKATPPVFAILGSIWTVLETVGDSSNALTKLYLHNCKLWESLEANIDEMLEHLRNFNEFEPESTEGEQFKKMTAQLITSIQENEKSFKENFPLDKQENFESITKDKLEKAKKALENIAQNYEIFMSSQWESQFNKHAKSWWQSAATGFGTVFTMFTGENVLDRYSRMIYEAKPGVGMINGLLNKINTVLSKQTPQTNN